MQRGRKPQSTRSRELKGNPGKRAYNTSVPTPIAPATGFDTPPRELNGDPAARATWRRLAPVLRTARQITEADRDVLIAYCVEWARYLAAKKLARPLDLNTKSPVFMREAQALSACRHLWNELGLTPSSRTRVATAAGAGPVVPDDPFAAEFDRPATH